VFPDEYPHLGSGTYSAMALCAALLFFSSLLLHELGHALCVARVPRSDWEHTRVRDCMLPRGAVPIVRGDEDLLKALDEMSESGIRRALVMDDGDLAGLLSMTDVARLVSWKTAGHA
jgi:CBS-domain-containing membrane protein